MLQKSQFPEVVPESFPAVLATIGPPEREDKPDPFEGFELRVVDVARRTFRAGHTLLDRKRVDATSGKQRGSNHKRHTRHRRCSVRFVLLVVAPPYYFCSYTGAAGPAPRGGVWPSVRPSGSVTETKRPPGSPFLNGLRRELHFVARFDRGGLPARPNQIRRWIHLQVPDLGGLPLRLEPRVRSRNGDWPI